MLTVYPHGCVRHFFLAVFCVCFAGFGPFSDYRSVSRKGEAAINNAHTFAPNFAMPRVPGIRSRLGSIPFEICEQRLVLSASGLVALSGHDSSSVDSSEVVSHLEGAPPLGQHDIQLGTHLNGVHSATGVDEIHDMFGFDGSNQTVAIIDSGIAYDHYALGGGYGDGHRVVGGWDFAENDANPYDDAPAGFHGTHVAGIVGSNNATHTGVAPGADLVALRVFDDQGGGNFDWVQGALQWVLDNQYTFDNPITTVNMSLGAVGQNLNEVPWWQMLEPELQALNEAGIFVSVSAGNDFAEFGTKGLSYPAVSPWVVPVSSANDAGTEMSDFSQRDDRVLVAPGESIASSVPDELFSFDGVPNDWARASGTSMASPYVAGSSVLLREAMQFMGYTDISQDDLYNTFRDTASLIYDDITQTSYHFIDVEAAIESVVTDSHGNTVESATQLGIIGDGDFLAGLVGRLDDVDYFTFTAEDTGVMSLAATSTHDMTAVWQLAGGGGHIDGNTLSLDVIAGESYTVSIASGTGRGHYEVNFSLEAHGPTVEDLGTIHHTDASTVTVDGESWFQVTASRTGIFTIQAAHNVANGAIDVEVFNSDGYSMRDSVELLSSQRADLRVAAGETFLFRLTGENSEVDLVLSNVVEISGDTVTVHGTEGDDFFSATIGESHTIELNGVRYEFSKDVVANIDFAGGAGEDRIEITGTSAAETALIDQGTTTFTSDLTTINAVDIENVSIMGGGGADSATIYDTAADDTATVGQGNATLQGDGFDYSVDGFVNLTINATRGGSDSIQFQDSAANDLFVSRANENSLIGGGFTSRALGFDVATATSTFGGRDAARFYDSTADDTFTATPDSAIMNGGGYLRSATGFVTIDAFSYSGGDDTAILHDSAGDDLFGSKDFIAYMSGDGFVNSAWNFQHVEAHSGTGGNDRATLYDGSGDDVVTAGGSRITMDRDGGNSVAANHFNTIDVFATSGGYDTAILNGTSGNDAFVASGATSTISGGGFLTRVSQFESVVAVSTGGNDTATFYDTVHDDRFTARSDSATMMGGGYQQTATGFNKTRAYALSGGDDVATFVDSSGDDVFGSQGHLSHMIGEGYSNLAWYFERVEAFGGNGGQDTVFVYDGAGDDVVTATANQVSMQRSGSGNVTLNGFDAVNVYAKLGGSDTAYLHGTAGDDSFVSSSNKAIISGAGYLTRIHGFEYVEAQPGSAGNDSAKFYDSIGDDQLIAHPDEVRMLADSYEHVAIGFKQVDAYSLNGGNDTAVLYDSAGDDLFYSRDKLSYMRGDGYFNIAWYFESVEGHAAAGGNDNALIYDGIGDDVATVGNDRVTMERTGFGNSIAVGFAGVTVNAKYGGNDTVYLQQTSASDAIARIGNKVMHSGETTTTRLFDFENVTNGIPEEHSLHEELQAVDYLFDVFADWA